MLELFGSVLDSPAGCMKLPLSFESVDQTLCCDHSLIQDFFIMKKNHLVPICLLCRRHMALLEKRILKGKGGWIL